MILCSIVFWISAFIIIWAMGGYALSLKVLGKIFSGRKLIKDYSYRPTVTVMIVAHNEEKVILDKLNNVISNDYPKDLIEYIVASDFSTDSTNKIVEKFIEDHPDYKIVLYKSREHKGKTNAQNEAQKIASGDILIMTDANAMFKENSISELVACFTDEKISYVTGKLVYKNANENDTASSESAYWETDLQQREIESRIKTITAGNGAIYACRNSSYFDFDPIKCHDSSMPYYYAVHGKRAIYNPDAIAYEKAGEITEDEFKRKVRMNRIILDALKDGVKVLNITKYGWFSYFYFGHRTCRYLLWFAHMSLYLISGILSFKYGFYKYAFGAQTVFYLVGVINMKIKSKKRIPRLISYYIMTLLAQLKGLLNIITGKSKATWEKAESTR